MSELELRNLTKRFGNGTLAVNNLNIDIADGELVVLVGPSGCGKSTSLRMVAGLEEVTDGEILIDGQVVNKLTPRERDIAMVFQTYALYPHMTVEANMGYPLRVSKVNADEKAKRVRAAAEILDITNLLDRRPRELSGGQRQRVAMGRAIVREPRVFLMDEPLSNLDAKLRVQMRGEIARLQYELGTTMMYVTHDQVEAMTIGDRVAVMRDGVLQQLAAPNILYAAPANVFVAGFIGSPPMNLCRAQLEPGDGSSPMVRFGSHALAIDPSSLAQYPRLSERLGQDVLLGTRPESFFVPTGDVPDGQRIQTRVDLVEFLGAEALVYLQTDAEPLASKVLLDSAREEPNGAGTSQAMTFVARIDPRAAPQRGELVDIAYEIDALHFFDPETGSALR